MAAEDVGSILYTVEMDVRNLITSERLASDRLDRLEGNLNRTADSASGLGSAVSKMAGAIAGALSIQKIVEYANAWVEVSNKLANSRRALEDSVKTNESLEAVLARVFKISQDSRSELEATATLYGRLERATRSAGTSTADLATLTTTINKAFVVSGASAEEAAGAITQLSQGLASGVLRGEEFNSVSENGSRLAVALADSLGVTIGQLRNMAAQGALTTDVVVNGLLSQADVIAKEFSNTVLTMGQAFTIANNNITKFVGENSNVITSLNVFNQAVVTVSQNLDVVANLIGVVAVGALARFSGSMATALAGRMADTAAALAQARATSAAAAAQAQAATVAATKAELDKQVAIRNQAVALTEYEVAKGTMAETFALENLNAMKSIAIQRSATYAEAQLAQAAATNTATAAAAAATTTIGSRLAGAFALLGGPTGAIVIAAAAVFYFYQKMVQAREESIKFADGLDGVISQMKTMSQLQLAATIDKAKQSIIDQKGAMEDLSATIKANEEQQAKLRRTLSWLEEGSLAYKYTLSQLSAAESEHTQLMADAEKANDKYLSTINKTAQVQAQFNGGVAAGTGVLLEQNLQLGVADGLLRQFAGALDIAGKAKDKFNASALQIPRSANGDKILAGYRDENDLLKITDKRTRAVAEARQKAFEAGVTEGSPQIKQIEAEAAANFDLKAAETERNKAAKANTKEVDAGAQKIADLQRQLEFLGLTYGESDREAAVLNATMAATGKVTDEQRAKIGELAGALFDAKQKQSDLNAAIEADPMRKENKSFDEATKTLKRQLDDGIVSQQQFNDQSEKLAANHQIALAQIQANQAVTPKEQAAGTVDPVQQLANENAQKLALIQAYEAQGVITHQNALMQRNALDTEYETARNAALWKQWADQSAVNTLMAGAIDSLGSSAASSITGILNGTQSANEALSNVANTILNSVVQGFVEMGIAQVRAAVTGAAAQQAATVATTATAVGGIATTTAASTAAAGTTLAAWLPAALVASVGSFGAAAIIGGAALVGAFALSKTLGKRKNGGPVTAGGMYQVGEGGAPELYQGANGRQYMIPGDNGSVISNKDLGTSGTGPTGSNVSVNVHNYGSSQVQTNQSTAADGTLTIDMVLSDFQEGGPLSQGIANNFTTKRKATQ
ncbi:MAG: tape measure protein [Shewanella sp.]|nr:tape measure protein [Shewanella sp.]